MLLDLSSSLTVRPLGEEAETAKVDLLTTR